MGGRPGPDTFSTVRPRDDVITHFDTTALGLPDPESVEFDPDNGHLYVLSTWGRVIETTRAGGLIQTISLAAARPVAVAGLAHAPASGDPSQEEFLHCRPRGRQWHQHLRERWQDVRDGLSGVSAPTDTPTLTPTATKTFMLHQHVHLDAGEHANGDGDN